MKRSDTLTWSHVRSGILIVAAFLIASLGVVIMGEKTKFFVPKGTITIVMDDVAGLKVGAPVWLAGVDVGIVTRIQFQNPRESNRVLVIAEVERNALHKIGDDSQISVKTRGLMGEKYVDIAPSAGWHETPPDIVVGTSPPKLDDVIRQAGVSFDRLDRVITKVERGEGTLGRLIRDDRLYADVDRLTRELTILTQRINRGEGTAGKLLSSDEPYQRALQLLSQSEEFLRELRSSEGTLGRLIHDPELYQKLVMVAEKSLQAAEDVRALNRKLTSPDSSLGMLLTDRSFYETGMETLGRLENSSITIEETLDRLNRGEGTAGKLLRDSTAYDRLNSTLDSLDTLLRDIRENPRRYLKFSLF
ncbi:MAG: MlaD family protein [Desulfuromonadia bacterium]